MQREIKFRGKRVNNGEWFKGYYFKTPLTDEATNSSPSDGWHFLSGRERHCISSQNGCVYEVIPETVGQFTGLKNDNGEEIYEGDILFDEHNEETHIVSFDEGRFIGYNTTCEYDLYELSDFIKIGNIHDNPELLEKEKEV